jgi:hypothetical protein
MTKRFPWIKRSLVLVSNYGVNSASPNLKIDSKNSDGFVKLSHNKLSNHQWLSPPKW